ncbi:D-sedoheptulose 7-phosphate isomerase [Methylolobus aquaticus]
MRRAIIENLRETATIMALMAGDNDLLDRIEHVVDICLNALRSGGKILMAGNGGSAADAQHLACEFVSRFALDRRGLAAIALSTDTSVLTAVGNDYGFERLFARQIEALGNPGDVFWGISTSGKSPNVLQALRQARSQALICVGLTGSGNGPMHELCDHLLSVPSPSTPKIQEGHIALGHIICGLIEQQMFRDGS